VRVLVVHAHPLDTSFNRRVLERVTDGLAVAGHEVDVVDLYRDGFDPVITEDELVADFDPATAEPLVASYVARLLRCDVLVFVHPTWWGGPPAIVKGWLDRVVRPGAAYDRVPGTDRIRGRLRNIRRLVMVTTHGSSKIVNTIQGEPGRHAVLRDLRLLCRRRCRTTWLPFYGSDLAERSEHAVFLERVHDAMARM
jgi:NAD(P)H dehydrogenase (quinone)